jgi:hypothetical protein
MTNAVNIAQSGSNNQTMRNRIINGAMVIDQRNAGAVAFGTSGEYFVDRWGGNNGGGATITGQQSTVAPSGFVNSLFVNTSSGGSPSAGQLRVVRQKIEGFNTADLAWGTASAQPVTVSFWVRSNVTGTFACYVTNSAYNRSQVNTFVISAANTWEQKSVTFLGDTSGTWGTTTGTGIEFGIDLGSGSDFNATAGVWNAVYDTRTSGSVTLSSTTSNNLYLTGVQFEEGTAASPFEYRLYGTELSLCRRYFARYFQNTNGLAGDTAVFNLANWNATEAYGSNWYQVSMRVAPSFSYSSLTDFTWYSNGQTRIPTAIDQQGASVDRCEMKVQWSSSIGAGTAGWLRIGGSANSGWIQWSAEL